MCRRRRLPTGFCVSCSQTGFCWRRQESVSHAATAPSAAIAGRGWGQASRASVFLFLLSLQIKYGDTATSEGVLFATYSALIGESQAGGQHRTRLKQILDWCSENFDGVVSFEKKQTNRQLERGKNCVFVIVLRQGAKSSGPSEVAGNGCAGCASRY